MVESTVHEVFQLGPLGRRSHSLPSPVLPVTTVMQPSKPLSILLVAQTPMRVFLAACRSVSMLQWKGLRTMQICLCASPPQAFTGIQRLPEPSGSFLALRNILPKGNIERAHSSGKPDTLHTMCIASPRSGDPHSTETPRFLFQTLFPSVNINPCLRMSLTPRQPMWSSLTHQYNQTP